MTTETHIWLSVDPMADQRSWVSPYNYCQNNPLNRVDPTGALDVLDNYSVDAKGNVKLEQSTTDGFDMLYSKEDWDAGKTSNGVKINDKTVLPSLVGDGDVISKGHTTGSIDDVFKTFLFCANNSNSEWGLARYDNDKYAVFTSHKPREISASLVNDLNNVHAFVHSHPNTIASSIKELNSMGADYSIYDKNKLVYANVVGSPGDWRNVRDGTYQSKNSYVFFPNSNNLYNLTPNKISLTGQVNSYKSFYFGVLNHR